MAKPIDLTGREFDLLKVISLAPPDRWGKRRWHCQCQCGKQVTVRGTSLTSGQTTSCGCKKETNLKGQHIGTLTVLERSDRYVTRGNRTCRLWKCLCDCGAITYKHTDTTTKQGSPLL